MMAIGDVGHDLRALKTRPLIIGVIARFRFVWVQLPRGWISVFAKIIPFRKKCRW